MYEWQNQWLEALYVYRTEGLDSFFLFLNFFDTNYFYFILIPVIWVGFSWRWGIRLFYLLVISGFLIHLLKEGFALPRPYLNIPGAELIPLRSFGFPSGGAQNALLLGALLIWRWPTTQGIILGGCYWLLISFSRIYLGVHYFTDVLGGWMAGAFLFYLFVRFGKDIENHLRKQSYLFLFLLSQVIPITSILLMTQAKIHFIMSGISGVGLFSVIASRFHLHLKAPRNRKIGILRGAIAAVGSFLFLFLVKYLIPLDGVELFIQPFILSFWLAIGASMTCLALIPNTVRDKKS